MGFGLQDVTPAECVTKSLGVVVDGVKGEIRLPPEKLARLVLACDYIAQKPYITGRQLQRIVGHVTYAAMLVRPLLAVLSPRSIQSLAYHVVNHTLEDMW